MSCMIFLVHGGLVVGEFNPDGQGVTFNVCTCEVGWVWHQVITMIEG